MRKTLVLLYGFVVRNLITIRRYPLNLLGTLLTFLLVFFVIFLGGKSIAPTAIGDSTDAIIVGYFLLTMVQSTFFFLSGMINTEAQYGTLEQLYVSPHRFVTVMFVAVLSNIFISIFMGLANLVVILVITGERLTIDVLTVAPVLGITLLHAIGLSFFFGGISLIYKRIQSFFSLVQFVFIGIISFSLTDMWWPRLLPVGQGAAMLHEAMANGTTLFEFTLEDHLVLVATGIFYITVGYGVFHLTQYRARQRGLLDDY